LIQTVGRYKEELYAKVCDKERHEQWCQIEDAFQVVGAKFEDFEVQRKEDHEVKISIFLHQYLNVTDD